VRAGNSIQSSRSSGLEISERTGTVVSFWCQESRDLGCDTLTENHKVWPCPSRVSSIEYRVSKGHHRIAFLGSGWGLREGKEVSSGEKISCHVRSDLGEDVRVIGRASSPSVKAGRRRGRWSEEG